MTVENLQGALKGLARHGHRLFEADTDFSADVGLVILDCKIHIIQSRVVHIRKAFKPVCRSSPVSFYSRKNHQRIQLNEIVIIALR